MKYRLVEKSSNQVKTTFHVLNSSDEVVGSVNVPPKDAADLLSQWAGPVENAKFKQHKQNPMVAAMLRVKPRSMSRAAILRGCYKMEYHGVSGMIRCALWLDVQLNVETLGIGRGVFDRKDSCTLEASGKHLAYWVMLDGGFIFLRVQLLDAPCQALDELMHSSDTKEGWQLICRVIRALERSQIRCLTRPIETGIGPNDFVIDY